LKSELLNYVLFKIKKYIYLIWDETWAKLLDITEGIF
jgi:hypothetical protein